jgi:hypothetical protein
MKKEEYLEGLLANENGHVARLAGTKRELVRKEYLPFSWLV